MTEIASLLEFATQVAELGGRVALEHFRRDPESKQKEDGSWVTEGDWKTEAQIRLQIARAFPDHNILGEEEGLTAAGGGEPQEGAPTWVVDPIDGTNNYLAGIPIWGTLVGLRVEGQAILGVAHAPALGETYAGGDGMGASMNGDPISVAPLTNLSEATSLIADAGSFRVAGLDEFFDRIVSRSWRTRGYGDFWGHMLVARGAAHVMIDPELRDWDYAALQPIIREAGGRITQIDGSDLQDGRSGLTTNSALHDEVVRLASGTLGRDD